MILLLCIGCSSKVSPYDKNKSYFSTKFYPVDEDADKKHPLVFLFGGSEGGMSFHENSLEVQSLLNNGYHVVTVAYFDYGGLQNNLNHININGFKKVLDQYAENPLIDKESIGVIGISKGGELALLLGSIYSSIHFVVAIVPSHVVFQASNVTLNKDSSWVYNDKEVPFVGYPRFNIATIKGVLDGENYREMHLAALKDEEAVKKARIKVENINGPIYLLSARYDHMWPSMEMSQDIMSVLKKKGFNHVYKHTIFNTNHDVLEENNAWQGVLNFLRNNSN